MGLSAVSPSWPSFLLWIISALLAALITDRLARRRGPSLEIIPEEEPPRGFGPMTVRRIIVRDRTNGFFRYFLPENLKMGFRAALELYDLDNNLIWSKKGRWAACAQAPDCREPDLAFIGLGQERVLNCVAHPYYDAGVYAPSRSIRFDPDWKETSPRIPRGRYILKVILKPDRGRRRTGELLLTSDSHSAGTRLESLEKLSTNELLNRYHWPGTGLP